MNKSLAVNSLFLALKFRETNNTTPEKEKEKKEEMENGSKKRWGFQGNQELNMAAAVTIRGVLGKVLSNLSEEDNRPVIPLGHGDPSAFPCFRTTPVAEDAIADAVRSAKFNSYAPTVGLLPARRYAFLPLHLATLFSTCTVRMQLQKNIHISKKRNYIISYYILKFQF